MGDAKLIGIWPLLDAPGVASFPKTQGDPGKLQLGGFSGLCCQGERDGVFTLVSISDRGPNKDPIPVPGETRSLRPFVFPSFIPEILITTWSAAQGWRYSSRVPLTWSESSLKTSYATGLPNSPDDEAPVANDGTPLKLDPRGLDPEGIVLQDDHYWIVEEYGPSILKIDLNGKILKRWIPQQSTNREGIRDLPAALGARAVNRGFEGVALVGTKLYAFLQSPLAPATDEIKVLIWDTKSESSLGLASYLLHDPKANKIGDVTSMADGRLLVLEQDGKTTPDALRKIFVWNPESGAKTLVADLSKAGYVGREKVEGLVLLGQDRLAIVSDNDYGLKNDTPSELALFEIRISP